MLAKEKEEWEEMLYATLVVTVRAEELIQAQMALNASKTLELSPAYSEWQLQVQWTTQLTRNPTTLTD